MATSVKTQLQKFFSEEEICLVHKSAKTLIQTLDNADLQTLILSRTAIRFCELANDNIDGDESVLRFRDIAGVFVASLLTAASSIENQQDKFMEKWNESLVELNEEIASYGSDRFNPLDDAKTLKKQIVDLAEKIRPVM